MEVRRADLLLALGDQDEVDGGLLSRAPDGVQGRQERGLRSLLVHGAAAHQDLAEPRLVHERRVPRGRRPLRGIDLLDVVHEVDPDGSRRPRVQRAEHGRMAVRGDARDVLEAGLAQQVHHQVAAFLHPPVLGGDRGLPDPLLQAPQPFVVALSDLGADGVAPAGRRPGGQGAGSRIPRGRPARSRRLARQGEPREGKRGQRDGREGRQADAGRQDHW
jgi:hypothetical protein